MELEIMSYQKRLDLIKKLKHDLDEEIDNQEKSDTLDKEILRLFRFNVYDDLWDVLFESKHFITVTPITEHKEYRRIIDSFVRFANILTKKSSEDKFNHEEIR